MANVVEVVVKSTNLTKAGFDEAKVGARETAASMDSLADAEARVTDASIKYSQATGALLDAQLKLQDVQDKEGASDAEITAAKDKVTAATLKQADAQIALLNAEEKQEAAARAASDADVAASEKTAAAAKGATDATKAQGDAALEAGGKSDAAGGLMAGMGSKLKLAGLGVAVGMGLAVKSAADFQQQSTRWVTSAGESVNQLGMLQQGVLALSAQTATSSEQLSAGLYTISSAGITGAGGLRVLKAAAMGAKAEGADLGEVTNALTSGLNAYGMKTKTAAEATASSTSMMNQMVATVSRGKMTMQELAGALSNVLPIAAANKISYAQVAGALATMTSMGVSARNGTDELSNTIRNLARPTSIATNEMSQFGISSTDVSNKLGERGLTGTMQLLSDAVTSHMGKSGMVIVNAMNQSKAAAADAREMLGKLPDSIRGVATSYLDGQASYKDFNNALKSSGLEARAQGQQFAAVAAQADGFNQLLKSGSPAAQTYAAAMSKMLGGATGLNVALMLTGSHAKTFSDNVKAISAAAANTASVSGFADVTKETSFQAAKAGESLKAAGTELGLALLPAVNAVLGPLASFLGMIAGNKTAAIAFAAVVGGLLAAAVGVKAVHALADMSKAMAEAGKGIEHLVSKMLGVGGAGDAQAAGSKKAADAAKTAAAEEESASGEAAAAQEADAAEVAAANEEAAATSSGSWLSSIGGQIAAAAGWVAENTAKVAIVVAENVAGALATAGAWMAANAVMLLGIGAVVAIVAVAVFEIVKHWHSIVHGVAEAFDAVRHAVATAVDAIVDFVRSHWLLLVEILTGTVLIAMVVQHWQQIQHAILSVVDDVVNFVEQHWELLLSILTGTELVLIVKDNWRKISHAVLAGADDIRHAVTRLVSDVVGDVERWFDEFLSAEEHGISNIVSWFEELPGRVLHAIEALPGMLFKAGKRILTSLLDGAESMLGGALSTVAGWGHDLANAIGSPFGIHFSDPSEAAKMIAAGRQIMLGITTGLKTGSGETLAYATGLAQKLKQQITDALSAGQISASQAATLTNAVSTRLAADAVKVAQAATKIGLAFNRQLMLSLEDPSTASAAKSAVGKLANLVQQAWSHGLIGNDQDSAISNWLAGQSQKLQALAGQRASIEKTIAAAKQFAASTASSVAGNYTISSFATSGPNGGVAPVSAIISGLRTGVTHIRQFAANLKKLAREGLNRNYINQLIQLGPEQGGAEAAELAAAGLGDIKEINSAESAISKTSGALGKQAADEMYDTGKNAGQGFLSGLRGTLKSLNEMIKQMAKSMVATLKKELGISSPSTVMQWHGEMSGQGFEVGYGKSVSRVAAISQRLARAAMPAQGGYGAYAGGSHGQYELVIRVQPTGNKLIDDLMHSLQGEVRALGGDPLMFQKKVAFR